MTSAPAAHLFVLCVGAVGAWSQRLALNPDGVAYRDLATIRPSPADTTSE